MARAGRWRLCNGAKGGVYSDLPIAYPSIQGLSAMSNVGTTGVGIQIWSRMVLSWAHHVTSSVLTDSLTAILCHVLCCSQLTGVLIVK